MLLAGAAIAAGISGGIKFVSAKFADKKQEEQAEESEESTSNEDTECDTAAYGETGEGSVESEVPENSDLDGGECETIPAEDDNNI